MAVLVLTVFAGPLNLAVQPARAAPFRTLDIGIVNMAVTTTNPLVMTLVDEYIIVFNVYSTLITYDGNYHVKGDLAYSWDLAPDQENWTFHLVTGAYFTDPTNPGDRSHPVTAADVAFSYNLNKNIAGSIFNSYAVNFVSVSAQDAHTVRIQTKGPFAAMESAASAIPILPEYIWGAVANPLHYQNANPIGSGAMYYDVTNTTLGSNIILRRNPNYYGDAWYCEFSRPDQVYYKDYSSAADMVSDFQAGTSGLDMIMNIDPASYTNALKDWAPKWTVDTGFVGEISLNVMSHAIATQYGYKYAHSDLTMNSTFRRAVAMSIDKQTLVDQALLGLGNVADSLVPDSNPWHYTIPASDRFVFDPTAARQMLVNAGWKYKSDGVTLAGPADFPLYNASGQPLSIRFYTLNTASEWQKAAILIQGWLNEAGIQTTDARGNPGYDLMTVNQISTAWFKGDYDMWLWDWVFTPASDPSLDVMEVETTQAIGPTSDNYYSNPEYDALYNQSLQTTNLTQRRALTDQLQKTVYDFASYILPYYRLDLYAATDGRPNVPAGGFPGWTNYGNWTQSVGLTPDSDLPNLWAHVSPLDNQAPQIQSFPSFTWTNGSAAPISVSVEDPENGQLTYNWDFGDGTYLNGTTNGAPDHTYAQPGNYTIKVRVTDSEWPACSSTKATIVPRGQPGANLPPVARADAVPTAWQMVNTSIQFNVTVRDVEDDPVYLTWNFGDGATAVSYATNTASNATVHQNHTYQEAGTYTVRIKYSDNQTGLGAHTEYLNITLGIRAPPSGGGGSTTPASNPLLDYGVPILIVAVIVIAAVAVLLRRRKQQKKEEAETQQPPQGPTPPPPTQ